MKGDLSSKIRRKYKVEETRIDWRERERKGSAMKVRWSKRHPGRKYVWFQKERL